MGSSVCDSDGIVARLQRSRLGSPPRCPGARNIRLAGAIVIQGGLDDLLPRVPQRLMVITSTQLASNHRTVPASASIQPKTPVFVNGVINPTVKIRTGPIQRWRIFDSRSDPELTNPA